MKRLILIATIITLPAIAHAQAFSVPQTFVSRQPTQTFVPPALPSWVPPTLPPGSPSLMIPNPPYVPTPPPPPMPRW